METLRDGRAKTDILQILAIKDTSPDYYTRKSFRNNRWGKTFYEKQTLRKIYKSTPIEGVRRKTLS